MDGKRSRLRFTGKKAGVWLAVLLLLNCAGCGYRFSPGGENLPPEIRTVFVDIFDNKTSEANFENQVRSAFIDQIIRGTRFKLADSKEAADAVLRGSIEGLSSSPLSYRATNLAAEERLTAVLNITLEDRNTGKAVWTGSGLSGTADYMVDAANPTVTQTNRRNNLSKLANDTAEKAYRLMMSGF
ncbi:MAG: hypothetical protein A4E73_03928 [Syntrophaceae bacterium PtaU1.Bin231]|nr:MAG: hypothetical protein A4E73_03928 [Syntrophaceae bacterium PtaU1.Bin231]HOG17508.1 LptE family protein [Syntrophales bacterium]